MCRVLTFLEGPCYQLADGQDVPPDLSSLSQAGYGSLSSSHLHCPVAAHELLTPEL